MEPGPSYKKILIFQTAFLGDAVLAIPLLKKLRTLFPDARLGLVCRKGFGEFFLAAGLIDEAVEVDKKQRKSFRTAFLKTRQFGAELIVSPHRSFRTALWVWRLGPKMSVGFRDRWSGFAYKKRILRPDEKHDVLRQLSLLKPWLGEKEILDQDSASLEVRLPALSKFSLSKRAAALAPGSQWSTKMWPVEYFSRVARQLQEDGHQVILLGAKSERALCADLEKTISGTTNLCGETTVLEMAQVLKQCRIFVGNDSGSMHVAVAVGTPVAAVFGPTVPSQGYAPWSEKSRVVQTELSCRPCGAHGHQKCPIGTHDCMKKVEPAQVLKAVKDLLS